MVIRFSPRLRVLGRLTGFRSQQAGRGLKLTLAGASSRLLIVLWLACCTRLQVMETDGRWLKPDWVYNGILIIEFLFRIWITGQLVGRLRDQNRELTESRAGLERPICLIIMIDVNHFKNFNDTYGHPDGDQILIRLAWVIRNNIRTDCDLTCRYGGEEFTVLFGGCLEVAVEVAGRIRRAFGQEPRLIGGGRTKRQVTLPLRVLERGPNEPSLSFMKRADQALYRSRAEGRNRVTSTIWTGPDRPEKGDKNHDPAMLSDVNIFGPETTNESE